MRTFSNAWISSKKPKKQRKFRARAPLHLRKKMVRVHLSSDMQKKHNVKALTVKVGDKVRIIRGDFKKQEGKVESIDRKYFLIYVAGVERIKRDGSKKQAPIAPANMQIIEVNTDDKLRLGSAPKKEKKSDKKQ